MIENIKGLVGLRTTTTGCQKNQSLHTFSSHKLNYYPITVSQRR